MIILDKPYISQLLMETIKEQNIPVLKYNDDLNLGDETSLNLLTEDQFFLRYQEDESKKLITNSENALETVYHHLKGSELHEITETLKNKALFREKTAGIYPDFHFRKVSRNELIQLSRDELSFPCILKPSIGFFSMGVYKIDHYDEWVEAIKNLNKEMETVAGLYPEHVMGTEEFLLEEYVVGDEYAIDVYYDNEGQPVVLNILKHLFSDAKDTSDRVYYTGKEIIQSNIRSFTNELKKIGEVFELHDYPAHIEFRKDSDGRLIPIELNPLRFAGWCTTDIASYAFGINPYEYYLYHQVPDWEDLLEQMGNEYYSITVADTEGVDASQIQKIAYDPFLNNFSEVLEHRKIDYHEYPVFAFVFSKTESLEELYKMLRLDLSKYLLTHNDNETLS